VNAQTRAHRAVASLSACFNPVVGMANLKAMLVTAGRCTAKTFPFVTFYDQLTETLVFTLKKSYTTNSHKTETTDSNLQKQVQDVQSTNKIHQNHNR